MTRNHGHGFENLCERYNRIVVCGFSRSWSYTGGSPSMSSCRSPAVLRRLMVAETALAMQMSESWVGQKRTTVDEVRNAGSETWWLLCGHGPELAKRADGAPASKRYAATLARWHGRQRVTQAEALAVAKLRLAEREARHQELHDLMHDLLGNARGHVPTMAEMWPEQYAN